MISARRLVFNPVQVGAPSGQLIAVTPKLAGWEHLSFSVRRMAAGDSYSSETGIYEQVLVLLGGQCTIDYDGGLCWTDVGRRLHVFDGMPYAAYLPRQTHYRLTGLTDGEIAICSAPATRDFPPCLITPDQVEVEIRGGGNATRQINHIIKPEFPADRLLVVEVYTPGGNWSSYPPHKHDVHNPPEEVDLEEIYYYKMDSPKGYAIQKVYTKDGRLDETLTVRDGQLLIIPEGYHPVVAAHGYNVYYLNALCGSARSMAASDDPDYAWVRSHWREKDPRVPFFTAETRKTRN